MSTEIPEITKAIVKLDLTFANGASSSYDFMLDRHPAETQPVTLQIDTENDIRDVTELSVDSWRRFETGDRRSIALSISGRGPINPPASSLVSAEDGAAND